MKDLYQGILNGSKSALSRGITLCESTLPKHQESAQVLLQKLSPNTGKSKRIGITGVPGVGKSTFINALGKQLIEESNLKVAVLSVDPSSPVSKGSILGDKTRMSYLAQSENAFVRPSPSGSTLGGVAEKTRSCILLCEAAGYDVVFVETVGVGQSEVLVYNMVDVFLLLLLPGAGDELQGIKKGVVEMADIIAVNKADGEMEQAARKAITQYRLALQLMHSGREQWKTPLVTCSSTEESGLTVIWKLVQDFYSGRSLYIESERTKQEVKAFEDQCTAFLIDWAKEKGIGHLNELKGRLERGKGNSTESFLEFKKAWLQEFNS
jgi:LAO/AO transport system kinase